VGKGDGDGEGEVQEIRLHSMYIRWRRIVRVSYLE